MSISLRSSRKNRWSCSQGPNHDERTSGYLRTEENSEYFRDTEPLRQATLFGHNRVPTVRSTFEAMGKFNLNNTVMLFGIPCIDFGPLSADTGIKAIKRCEGCELRLRLLYWMGLLSSSNDFYDVITPPPMLPTINWPSGILVSFQTNLTV
ncbi:hypothetical protein BDZ97DRAFT_1788260 [Flammula alnicola]|nr:hypothetical protein BDZ97DRAFT_1788260 [Flammula alnicola]